MWERRIEYQGLPFYVSTSIWAESEVVCIPIRRNNIIQAIRSRDTRVLDFLNLMLGEADEISLVMWASENGSGFYHIQNHLDDEEKYLEALHIVCNSKYADPITIEATKHEIEQLKSAKQRVAQREAKQQHVKKRRNQFAANHDRLMLALIERDGYQCAECGTSEDLTIDHVIPLSRGGRDELENLRLLCRTHNSLKCDKVEVRTQ